MNMDKTTATRWPLCLSLLAPLFLSACSGGSSSGATGDTSDTTAPTVTSTSPLSGATAVARNSTLTATFNEDIFATTVDTSSFTLAKSGSGTTSGTVSFDGVDNVASLAPDNSLAALATYTATLTTAITDLSGNALAANVSWSFTTADGAWGSAALIETDNTGIAYQPQIAVDSSGNALAVWTQSDGARFNILANRFDGNSWGSAVLIETDNAGSAYQPQIAVDSSGNALAVWTQYDGTRDSIWANRFDGSSWGSAALIETDNTGSTYQPQIAVDSNGNALAVWAQSGGTRVNIRANRFNGSNWGNAVLIETNNDGDADSPQIAIDSSGNAVAVWRQSDGARDNIWANRFDGSSWGSAALIETDNTGSTYQPQIAVDSNGNALAVWAQSGGTRVNIRANRFNGSNWGNAVLIETNNDGDADSPQIAIDSSGNALVVWRQYDGTRTNIWANRFE